MDTHAVTTDVPALARLQRWGLVAGFWGLLAGVIGAFLNVDQFLRSWLIGFLFCMGLSMGSLALLMMQHMTGGQWGLVSRRVCEAAARNLPFVALMFVPVLLGLPRLYTWAVPGAAATDHVINMKSPYLNVPFFVGRAVLFFAVWVLFVQVGTLVATRRRAAFTRSWLGCYAAMAAVAALSSASSPTPSIPVKPML